MRNEKWENTLTFSIFFFVLLQTSKMEETPTFCKKNCLFICYFLYSPIDLSSTQVTAICIVLQILFSINKQAMATLRGMAECRHSDFQGMQIIA